ncbi:MAG TPA: DUF2007 domain-containing protein, partial [Candidatus Solibacter sp.]|nr:DUF2007 domain-containing protein [Candidatus Solibacter sp.]
MTVAQAEGEETDDLQMGSTSAEEKPAGPVTVRAFRDLPEAQVAKTILESANIKCFLADENLVRMDWFYSNLIGGIKLWVTEEDLQAAQALLKAEMPEEFEVEGVGEFRQP